MERILSVLQEDQQWGLAYMNLDTYAQEIADIGDGYAIFNGDKILGVGGFQKLDQCRATCWSLLADDIGADFFYVHKAVLKRMQDTEYQRLEVAVAEMHVEAHRWTHMLGFKPEGTMKKYFPDGSNATLWARIK